MFSQCLIVWEVGQSALTEDFVDFCSLTDCFLCGALAGVMGGSPESMAWHWDG